MTHLDQNVIKQLKLEVSGRYSELGGIRQIVSDACQWAGLAEDQCAKLEMVVDEACANIIEHSYGGEPADAKMHEHTIRVHLKHYADRVIVEIYDHGTGFDLDRHPAVPPQQWLDEKRDRGLGMYIITHFVDDVTYQRGTRSGNYLRLTKRL